MKTQAIERNDANGNQRGNATLTSVLIMGLLAIFVATSLARVTTESIIMGNDYSHTQSFYAAQASLELMSRDFNNIFDVQLRPTPADLSRIQTNTPAIDGFSFVQTINPEGASAPKPIDDGPFSGLISVRTPWNLTSVANYQSGAQVQLTRTFFNHQIPLFQFGIFYNDDMELHPGPVFNFGGRVHSNRHIFLAAGNNLYFRSRVTAAGEVIRYTSRMGARSGDAAWTWGGSVWVADAAGTNREVIKGSVVNAAGTQATDPDMPNWAPNTTWSTDSAIFNGNLLARQKVLRLPLQIGTTDDPIELVKRGSNADTAIMRDSRYYNKPGIRVTLSDSQSRLPGAAGGVRLDGSWNGLADSGSPAPGTGDGTRGYLPVAMTDSYQATRVNGFRLYTGASYTTGGMPANRQTWIKIEVITLDANLAPVATDATADFLSLGVTHRNPSGLDIGDSRAIFKLQRYEMVGPPIKVAPGDIQNTTTYTSATADAAASRLPEPREPSPATRPVYTYASGMNFVATSQLDTAPTPDVWRVTNAAVATQEGTAQSANDPTPAKPYEQIASVGSTVYRVVPFPIKMYTSREGLYNEDLPTGSSGSPGNAGSPTWWWYYTGTAPGSSLGTTSKVPVNGVISLIDIDMTNLGNFFRGDWNGLFPANAGLPGGSLSSDDILDNGGSGYIVYVSDRRGDADNDGEYDMEDIYGPNDGTLQAGEDVNRSGALDVDYTWEAARYNVGIETDIAATRDHKYFRRGVRLINGAALYGTINKGYSVASENGLYTLGNYNATGVAVGPSASAPTPYDQYTGTQVPCSLVSDAVTFLSNNWNDARSFRSPCNIGTRTATETTIRAALLMGDSRSSLRVAGSPNQGGGDANMSGGVHNFPRFLESWGTRANYCGSLINLFNSRQHNGAHKNGGGKTYNPPTRNWVFDATFLDPNRLPPGTPFFQYVQMTGFRQTFRQTT